MRGALPMFFDAVAGVSVMACVFAFKLSFDHSGICDQTHCQECTCVWFTFKDDQRVDS